MKFDQDYLQLFPSSTWDLDKFGDWCLYNEVFKGDKCKILDHIKRSLKRVSKDNAEEAEDRSKAEKMLEDLQVRVKLVID